MPGVDTLHLYNDTPIIEEGSWKLQAPTKWGVKWRHIPDSPIVVHNCEKDNRRETVVAWENMKNAPRCGLCEEEIPEGIQAVWQLTHMTEMAS
jgi:NAD-dependent dihydropyrimidine dehydrogenase PreA subunit